MNNPELNLSDLLNSAVTEKRKYTKNKIGLKGARSFSSLKRLEYALRANNVQYKVHIVAMRGDRFVPVFQEFGMPQETLEHLKQNNFAVA